MTHPLNTYRLREQLLFDFVNSEQFHELAMKMTMETAKKACDSQLYKTDEEDVYVLAQELISTLHYLA